MIGKITMAISEAADHTMGNVSSLANTNTSKGA